MIPVNTPLLDGNELAYLTECVQTGWISSEGPFVKRFEDEFAAYTGRAHGIAVTNGTAALDMAIAALEIGPGDEVILPSHTIISCAGAIVRAGATPVLIDSDPHTWNAEAGGIEERITERTKAIMVVHTYGLPVDMDPVMEIAQRHGIPVVEDASEMHGQTYRGRKCGTFGAISTFSFYPNKHITTGEGGMAVVDDPHLAERCRSLRNLCFQASRRFVHEELGWNLRMTNLQAAVGVAQLERIEGIVQRKRAMGRRYDELLAGVPGIQLPLPSTEYAENIYWVYGIVLDDAVPFDAAEAMRRLGDLGVGTRPFFWPMHEQPVFQKMGLFADASFPVAERLARRGFYIPSGLGLDPQQQVEVADFVNSILAAS